jgi:hypothetical protein
MYPHLPAFPSRPADVDYAHPFLNACIFSIAVLSKGAKDGSIFGHAAEMHKAMRSALFCPRAFSGCSLRSAGPKQSLCIRVCTLFPLSRIKGRSDYRQILLREKICYPRCRFRLFFLTEQSHF